MKKIKKLNRDGYIGKGATTRKLLKKVNELVKRCNDLDEQHDAEMNGVSDFVWELKERMEKHGIAKSKPASISSKASCAPAP